MKRMFFAHSCILAFFLTAGFKNIHAQTPNIGHASGFGVLSGGSINTLNRINVLGNVGSIGIISDSIIATDTLFPPNHTRVQKALTDLDSAINATNILAGTLISGNLNNQALTPGIYKINGNASLSGTLTFTTADTGSIYIINVNGDLSFFPSSVIDPGVVKGNNVFWNVSGNIVFHSGAIVYGIFMNEGSITSTLPVIGKFSLLSKQTITWAFSAVTIPDDNTVYSSNELIKYYTAISIPCQFAFTCNFVRSPGFELNSSCPNSTGQVLYACPWVQPTAGTSDYFNACSTVPICDVPQGTQFARTGTAMTGAYTYTDGINVREYIQQQLFSPLISGKEYYIEFYTSLDARSTFAADGLGMLLSSIPVTSNNNQPLSAFTPQISNTAGKILTNTGWANRVNGCYTATGGEQFITIGNFKNDASTNKTPRTGNRVGAYYFFDDVTITEVKADAGPDKTINCAGSVIIGATSNLCPIAGSTYNWFPATNLNCTNCPNPTATPPVTTNYTLTVTFPGGCTASDEVNVTVVTIPLCCIPPNKIISGSNSVSEFGPNATVNSQVLDISGTFIVNSNLNLSGCTVRMAPGAKIIIQSPFTLTVTNTSRLFSCTNLWQGIEIQPGAFLIADNSSSIEDAEHALVSKGGATSAGSITLNGAILNKNHKHIVIEPFTTGPHPTNIRNTQFVCRSNPSTSPGATLKGPRAGQRTSTGIEMTGVDDITIGVPLGGLRNTFENMDFGINIINCNKVNVFNNLFRNLSGTQCPAEPCNFIGIGILGNIAQNIVIGGPGQNRNIFNNCFQGVDITDFITATVNGNSFTNTTAGTTTAPLADHAVLFRQTPPFTQTQFKLDILTNSVSNWVTGIHFILELQSFLSNTAVNISSNAVNSFLSGFHNGIIVESIIPPAVVSINNNWNIRLNTINSATTGIRKTNLIAPVILTESNNVLLRPGAGRTGIFLQNTSQTRIQSNIINGTGSSIANVSGIRLEISPNNVVNNNTINFCFNGLHMRGTNNPPPVILTCNKMISCNRGVFLDATDISDQRPGGGVPSDNQWFTSANVDIFRTGGTQNVWDIRNASTFVPSQSPGAIIINLLLANSPSNCPTPPPPCDPACLQNALSQVAKGQIHYTSFSKESKFLASQTAFSILAEQPQLMSQGSPKDAILQNFYDSLKLKCIGRLHSINKLIGNGNISQAISENNAMVTVNKIEKNHKDFNGVYLATLGSGIKKLNNQQHSLLKNIAGQCPLTGGTAVYQARTLLSAITGNVPEYAENCPVLPSPRMKTDKAETEGDTDIFKVYPNPTNGLMQLDYFLGQDQDGIFVIYDVTGKIQSEYKLQEGNNTLSISEGALENGIYFYQIIVNGIIEAKEKIIIIK